MWRSLLSAYGSQPVLGKGRRGKGRRGKGRRGSKMFQANGRP